MIRVLCHQVLGLCLVQLFMDGLKCIVFIVWMVSVLCLVYGWLVYSVQCMDVNSILCPVYGWLVYSV